ncbi:hypothetical protein COY07_05015 [Candidatus Peregrinibacteria bacterium CG_4_10_14_0_2_um_filter_43_11]|nr:MAG: hypothetical protein COY07_05015 [Candidatus Peregrinibacteria bacterium CG_4_10_14_0_2_um_filter_43_11]
MLKKLIKFIGLGLIILVITAVMMNRGIFIGAQKSLQNKFYDFNAASSKIVIVTVDEKSLEKNALGPLQQWSRDYYARAIEILNQKGAAAIGLDMTFPDASGKGIEDDTRFRDVLKKYENVVLATRYYFENGERQAEWPTKTLLQVNPKMGWINVALDEDGFVRRIPLFAQTNRGVTESFSLQLARIYEKASPVDYRITDHQFRFSETTAIPVMTEHDSKSGEDVELMYINYFAKPNSFKQVSFVDVLNRRLVDKQGNPVDFKDKIVLIGPTAIDLQDDYLSPVSSGVRMPGVEIHANAIQTVITDQFLRDQSPLSLWLTFLGLLAMNLLLFGWLKLRYALPVLAFEMVGILISGIVGYEWLTFVNVVYPLFLIILTFVGAFLLRFLLEQKELRFIEGAFGHYVNKEVVAQIMKNPKLLELGGVKRTITTFFSDIEGFTTFSEAMEPKMLTQFLNEYFGKMTDIILENQGTLDKYEGDAIVAFWGAPLEVGNHAQKTCLTALTQQQALLELRKRWEKEGYPEIRVRMGIHTGEAVVGNMGSEDRFDYTAMGDTMNLGSRLEGVNKQYGTSIIISESTYVQVKDSFVCRELDRIRVKGKNEPVTIYELVGKKGEVNDVQTAVIQSFESALVLYRKNDFTVAQQQFTALADDAPSKRFAKRCEEFTKNPPANDWDGVWVFEVK